MEITYRVDTPRGDLAEVFHNNKLGSPTGIERSAENKLRSSTAAQSDLKVATEAVPVGAVEGARLRRVLNPESNKPLILKCGPSHISRSSKRGKMISLIFPATVFKPCIRVANSRGGLMEVFVVEVSIQSFILP